MCPPIPFSPPRRHGRYDRALPHWKSASTNFGFAAIALRSNNPDSRTVRRSRLRILNPESIRRPTPVVLDDGRDDHCSRRLLFSFLVSYRASRLQSPAGSRLHAPSARRRPSRMIRTALDGDGATASHFIWATRARNCWPRRRRRLAPITSRRTGSGSIVEEGGGNSGCYDRVPNPPYGMPSDGVN